MYKAKKPAFKYILSYVTGCEDIAVEVFTTIETLNAFISDEDLTEDNCSVIRITGEFKYGTLNTDQVIVKFN